MTTTRLSGNCKVLRVLTLPDCRARTRTWSGSGRPRPMRGEESGVGLASPTWSRWRLGKLMTLAPCVRYGATPTGHLGHADKSVSYTHLRAHETDSYLV